MKWTVGPTDFKKIFRYISLSKMQQIGQPRTVLNSSDSKLFKTVIGCPIWCIFDQDIYLKIFLKSVGWPVRFIFSLYLGFFCKKISIHRKNLRKLLLQMSICSDWTETFTSCQIIKHSKVLSVGGNFFMNQFHLLRNSYGENCGSIGTYRLC